MSRIVLRILNTAYFDTTYHALPWPDLAHGLPRLANWLPRQNLHDPQHVEEEAARPFPHGIGATPLHETDGLRVIENPKGTGTTAIVTLQLDPNRWTATVKTHEKTDDSSDWAITGTAETTSEDNREAHRLAAAHLEKAIEKLDEISDAHKTSPDFNETYDLLWQQLHDQQERARHFNSGSRARREGELREAAAEALPLLQAIAGGDPIDQEAAHRIVGLAAAVIGPAHNLHGLIPTSDD